MNKDQARTVMAALDTGAYEHQEDGSILLTRNNLSVKGTYVSSVNGGDVQEHANIWTNEGLIYLLSAGLYNGTKLPTWYLALYSGNYTPVATITAASFPATASEITSVTEGYTETTRRTWTPAAPSANTIDNYASPGTFTIATASSVTVYGAALLSDQTKGAVTGTLASITRFTTPRVLYATDSFQLGYRCQLQVS